MSKMRIAVLFGGMSGEHEISCLSAAAVVDNLDDDIHEIFKLGITKKGRWLLYPGGTDKMRDGSWETFPDCVPAFISPDRTNRGIVTNHDGAFDVIKLDMVFPVLHGTTGEDGVIQGLLELSGLSYVGCGVLASAICMNKPVANLIFAAHNIPHTPWFAVDRYAIEDFGYLTDKVGEYLQYPIFVKPASGGSSLGITKVTEPAGLRQAMLLASAHDRRILLEQGVDGCEVECAVIGNNNPYATLPGEIVPCNEIYDYEAKYESGDKSALHIPARLPQEKLEEVRELALRAYQATGCTGLARVDFFVEKGTGKVFISEINTMPGFTDISMYPKLMQQLEKHTFSELLHSLVVLAVERAEQ